jgi:hypothetical protein
MSSAEYVTTSQWWPQDKFQGHRGLFSVTEIVAFHHLVRMSGNIAQAVEVQEAVAAVVVLYNLTQSDTNGLYVHRSEKPSEIQLTSTTAAAYLLIRHAGFINS